MNERTKIILELCKNRTVLDIGCIDHNSKYEKQNKWLHKNISKISKEIVGLDYLKSEVKKLQKKGYNIKYGNAEKFKLNKKFDVIVAGELIEHLFNQGNFLDSVKKHMHKESILIITTPNVFSIRRIIGSIFKKRLKENPEHTAYYSNTILTQLLNRKGFKNIKIRYLASEDENKVTKYLEKLLYIIFRKENKHTLFVVAKK